MAAIQKMAADGQHQRWRKASAERRKASGNVKRNEIEMS
jgi:hypothetical protein